MEGSQEEPPPKLPPGELTPAEGTALAWTEVDLFPELRVEGAIPVVRPSFAFYVSGLTGASSLEEFLAKYVVPGTPIASQRLYAGKSSLTPNLGAMAWINGYLDPSGTFSWATTLFNFKEIIPDCYSTSEVFIGLSPWDVHFYLGGDGGDAPSGNCPVKSGP